MLAIRMSQKEGVFNLAAYRVADVPRKVLDVPGHGQLERIGIPQLSLASAIGIASRTSAIAP